MASTNIYCPQTNTYQAIIISDGAETYSVMTYNCGQLNWIGEVDLYASVGFNVLGTAANFRNFDNHGLSRTPDIGMIACNQTSLNVTWTNLIYRIGVSVNQEQLNRSRCLAKVAQDELTYPIPSELLSILFSVSFGLSDCPCSLNQALRDFRFGFSFFDDRNCLFSRFPRSFNGIFFFLRCCYSERYVSITCLNKGSFIVTVFFFSGALISEEDPNGYGSILFYSLTNRLAFQEYRNNTIRFQEDCCDEVGLCDQFYRRRIPNRCTFYEPSIFCEHTCFVYT